MMKFLWAGSAGLAGFGYLLSTAFVDPLMGAVSGLCLVGSLIGWVFSVFNSR